MIWVDILAWVAAIGFAAWYLLRIAKSLAGKAAQLAEAAEPLSNRVIELAKASGTKPVLTAVEDNLLDSPLEIGKVVLGQQITRKKRAADRQRRLIDRLKP
ncbi:MAG: hypothetical protein ACKOWJ_00245 [Micrococcales bacterium]